MMEFVFTLDYEVYGNGRGPLRELVYEPAARLNDVFRKRGNRFVVFVEAAELEMIETQGSDPDIGLVKHQVRALYEEGHEIGLHLHPQWYNGRYEDGEWVLDHREYNLCRLPRERIAEILDRAIGYLRGVLRVALYRPFCYRAGNWLLQPTDEISPLLTERGVRVDSSVFPGGRQHSNGLDYRPALMNGVLWRFSADVNVPDPEGTLLELPIHTKMVPIWNVFRSKRIGLQKKRLPGPRLDGSWKHRFLDMLRFCYPLKLDFCRMTRKELIRTLDPEIREDRRNPRQIRPLVAIGHTKDLEDLETVEFLLTYLHDNGVRITTFRDVYSDIG